MNVREQFLSVMNFEKNRQVPMLEFMGFWTETETLWKQQGHVRQDENLFEHFSLSRNEYIPVDFNFIPAFEEKILDETETHLIMRDSVGVVKQVEKNSSAMPHYIEFPIKDRQTFEDLKERLNPSDPQRYPEDWPEKVKEYQQRTFPLGLIIRGPFAFCRDFVNFETLMMLVYDDYQLLQDMTSFQADFTIELWDKALRDVEVDFIYLGEDMAYKTGPMFSPDICRELIFPNYVRIIDFLKSKGVNNIILDSDGCILQLIDLYVEAGVTCIYPLEQAAGMDPVKIRKKYPKLQMIGGIDKLNIAEGSDGIDREIDKVKHIIDLGGWIPCIDHSVPPIVPYENYSFYLEKLRQAVL